MLQSQVNYWNLQEQIRHNKETEKAAFEQSAASTISANASRMQAEIAKELMPFEKMKAQSTVTQAQASLMQADAALQNAETNRGNLDVNRMNAVTNQRNAEINQQNADTNLFNAWVNQQNADTNAFNAETNRMVGESQIERNRVENMGTLVSAGLDAWRTQTEKQIAAQEQQKTPFTTANQVVGLLNQSSQTLRNVTGSVTDAVNTVSNIVGHHNNSGKQSSGNEIVKHQLGIVSTVLPIITKLVK